MKLKEFISVFKNTKWSGSRMKINGTLNVHTEYDNFSIALNEDSIKKYGNSDLLFVIDLKTNENTYYGTFFTLELVVKADAVNNESN